MGTDERGPGAGESSADEPLSGVTRREAIKKGAIVGGTVMWVAPLVQSVGMTPASAQTVSPQPGDCVCGGTNSFDVTATLTGLVGGADGTTLGPFQNFPEESGCLVDLSVTATGTTRPFVIADGAVGAEADCVGGTTTGGTCSAFVELANLAVDLTAINAALDIQLDASVVRAEATCTCGGGCQASACITQADGQAVVTVAGQPVEVGTGVEVCGETVIDLGALGLLPGVTGSIVLNRTSNDPCQATVATIDAVVEGVQTVSIVIARATAVCTQA